ncbi:MAG: efflux RND transporter periplasmic adaptor subunit [Limnobacter sp.]|nr:efflux RND transporter periplasmic adaptor subunit [Limnobacter sp.]
MTTPENHSSKPLFQKKWVQALAVVVVLAIGVAGAQTLIATAPKAEKRPSPKKARLVQDMEIQSSQAQVDLVGYGVVQAEQLVAMSARVSGTVERITDRFVPGQKVKKGDLLIELDDTDYQLELATAKANLAQAQASLAQEQGNQAVAQADFDLLDLDVSEREKNLILRKPQLQSAQASVASATAAVQRAEVNLARTQIRAPFTGIVVSRQAAVGLQVSPSTALGQLASSDHYWINVALPQEDLKWIEFPSGSKKGSTVCVTDTTARSQRNCHPGKVLQLQGAVQDNGRQAQVLVEVKNNPKADTTLLLSQYVKVNFKGSTLDDVFALDPRYVHGDTVWLNEDGTLRVQPIEVAFRSQQNVLVSGGLNNGQRVVTSNLSAAIDGMAIRTESDTEAGTQAEGAKP